MPMRLLPLGTGAGRPTRHRQTTSILVESQSPTQGTVRALVDCGEATQHRLMSQGISPNSLDAVCCTHLHGDHVLTGLPGLLGTMGMDDRQRPLRLIGPAGLAEFLQHLSATPALNITFPLEVDQLDPDGLHPERPQPLEPIGQVELAAAPLDHRVPTIGFRLSEPRGSGGVDLDRVDRLGVPRGPLLGRLQRGEPIQTPAGRSVTPGEVLGSPQPGTSVAFCFDTRPCRGALALAAGADLLVHDATFATAEAELAERYGHSTAAQAALVARDAGAQRLLLTHFSARYRRLEDLRSEAAAVHPSAELAHELSWLDLP
ncbi:MAG: ribonuclease Z [Microthrixaceae bacterium]